VRPTRPHVALATLKTQLWKFAYSGLFAFPLVRRKQRKGNVRARRFPAVFSSGFLAAEIGRFVLRDGVNFMRLFFATDDQVKLECLCQTSLYRISILNLLQTLN